MFTAKITVCYGTGAPAHRFYSGTGSAVAKSPKRAVKLAARKADAASGDGPEVGGVVFLGGEITNLDTGKVTPLYDYAY